MLSTASAASAGIRASLSFDASDTGCNRAINSAAAAILEPLPIQPATGVGAFW